MKKMLFLGMLLLLVAIVFYFFKDRNKSTLQTKDSNFAIADTAAIQKIFIADKGDKEILLERKSVGYWTVNNRYKARPGSMGILLETIKRIRPLYPVARAAHNNVIKNLASEARKVEIYTQNNEEPAKTYYIGGTTLDRKGNFMLMEGAEQPYAVHIPGFVGYFSGRFILEEELWRDRTVFSYRPEEIKSITLTYPMEPEKSFHLAVINEQQVGLYKLQQAETQKPIPLQPAAALNYLQAYRFLACEAFNNDFTHKDSLLQQAKKNILTVENKKGVKKSIDIYYMPVNKRSKTQFDKEGNRVLYDVDRYYAIMNDGKDHILIQQYVFGKVLKTYNELLSFKQ